MERVRDDVPVGGDADEGVDGAREGEEGGEDGLHEGGEEAEGLLPEEAIVAADTPFVCRERVEHLNGVRGGAGSRSGRGSCCLLYTSPSPRDS